MGKGKHLKGDEMWNVRPSRLVVLWCLISTIFKNNNFEFKCQILIDFLKEKNDAFNKKKSDKID